MRTDASELRSRLEAALEHRIPHALTIPQRPAPERMSTGLPAVDALIGGVPLGCLAEICGPASSGRTSVLLSLISESMRRGEICALVDVSDAFDPQSAANAGVDLGRLLWVRCGKEPRDRGIGSRSELKSFSARKVPDHRIVRMKEVRSPDHPIARSPDSSIEQALKATDLLLRAGGFGLVILDLADVPVTEAQRIPLTTWFRFRRAVENTSTIFLVVERQPHAKSCAALVMDFSAQSATWSEAQDQLGTPVSAHSSSNVAPSFRVTAEGVAIPFERSPTSSFENAQRWSTPHARLLNTVHVHLQVTRSRGIDHARKFPVQPQRISPFQQELMDNPKDPKHTKALQLLN